LAQDPIEQARGLSGRTSVPEGTGMLFDMRELGIHSFWMKDVSVPLDLIFIQPDGTIVGIISGAKPFDLEPRRIATPSRFVLETPAGWAWKNWVTVGQRVTFSASPA
jgi:uncharacterized membrane protein (UPF0127 family)